MRIHSLKLRNFRNHAEKEIEWAPQFNIITGPNGVGKTNILDAIHLLCMSRSFVTSTDRVLPLHGEQWFELEGKFESAARSEFSLKSFYSTHEGKTFFVNDSPLERLSDLIGRVPVVVMSPEDRKLTAEGPLERRSFLDGFIAQISQEYLQNLLLYRRIRRQRSTLLQQESLRGEMLRSALEPWNVQLADVGGKIIATRASVLDRFSGYLEEHFKALTQLSLRPHFSYKTFIPIEAGIEAKEVSAQMLVALDEAFEKEQERRQSLIGPHRDELIFYLDDIELRKYGSQGQHRLFTIALKLAQSFYYQDQSDDQPILLMDDVFGNLDTEKIRTLVQILERQGGQIFITHASGKALREAADFSMDQSVWYELTEHQLQRFVKE